MKDKDIQILPMLWVWRRHIIMSVGMAMVVMSIVTILTPNYYQASTLFYPVNESLQSPIVEISDRRSSLYGNDNDVDRLLSIAQSKDLKTKLSSDMDLFLHYNLSKDNIKDRIKLNKKIQKHYKVLKTEFDAIEISYEDQNPEKAALYANKALEIVNQKALDLANESRSILLNSLQSELAQKETKLKALTDQIKTLKEKFNIYDSEYQAEAFASLEVKSPNNQGLQKRISDYTKGVSELKQLEVQQNELSKILVYEQNELSKLQANANKKSTALHIIEAATPPIEKSRPRRSLFVLAAGVMTFLFACLTIFTLNALRHLDWDN